MRGELENQDGIFFVTAWPKDAETFTGEVAEMEFDETVLAGTVIELNGRTVFMIPFGSKENAVDCMRIVAEHVRRRAAGEPTFDLEGSEE